MINTSTNPPRLLRLTEVRYLTGLSKSSIYNYMNKGLFPHSIALGLRSVAWAEYDIQLWINDRINIRDQMVAS
ncbi:AlpA family transcriptional regulator [Moritella sp.]|uniref:helix-turn-helix transcriptional regulator n=1 Tax=Moritella sp. TaxID=78556 RepID=UPI001DE504BE|nr:AlpA family transcriptional regulator [Moritella sp.]MCJ8349177.1 AlpA family transcriptional regulator [Moritella sp.]NQZ39465.1 AlpA family transcriptional regulator [Moritella sp.]